MVTNSMLTLTFDTIQDDLLEGAEFFTFNVLIADTSGVTLVPIVFTVNIKDDSK